MRFGHPIFAIALIATLIAGGIAQAAPPTIPSAPPKIPPPMPVPTIVYVWIGGNAGCTSPACDLWNDNAQGTLWGQWRWALGW